MALVAVLWVFILLSVIAAGFTSVTRTDARIAGNVIASAAVEAAADAAVHQASVALVAQQGRNGLWRTDGVARALEFDGVEIIVSIVDEGGKVDLNAAEPALIADIFDSFGVNGGDIAAAIEDWRDADDFAVVNGAEDGDYASRGYPYGAKDAPFDTVSELRLVMGMTPDLYEQAAPLLTVYSARRGIDPSVAPRAVLVALPQFDADTADQIIAAREAAAAGGGAGPLGLPGNVLAGVQGYFAQSQRNTFRISAVARSANGAVFVREAVVFLSRNSRVPYLFMEWARGRLIPEKSDVSGSPQ